MHPMKWTRKLTMPAAFSLLALAAIPAVPVLAQDKQPAAAPAMAGEMDAMMKAMSPGPQHKLLRHIIFPAALPSIFSGLRIGIGSAWMLTVTAEMVAVKSGVGYVLWDSYYFLRYDLVIAAMASIGLLGYLSDFAVKRIGARLLRWQHATTIQGA